ncbi:hypothetical protein [Maricaulis virginensis]|uniref:Uncharacterized protein n=1 Tax=Maricaulis virginensis TaxID=144022 RepID=A0A9W6IHY4_9PROT|nr:hypothetical protein [Maricaulis virginensis]GLK50641.1 hypothetical protein GCM10017621_01490 [Maricaulis virginensis]
MSALSRLTLSAATMALLAPAALAFQGDPVDDVLACRLIADIETRLACFDETSTRLANARDTGDIVVVEREAVEAVERDSFGFNLPSLPRFALPNLSSGREQHEAVAGAEGTEPATPRAQTPGREATPQSATELAEEEFRVVARDDEGNVDTVTMRLERIRVVGYDTMLFEMENGQVWRQTDDGRRIRLRGQGPHFAEIRRGAMSSYLLRIDGEGRAVRVRREE